MSIGSLSFRREIPIRHEVDVFVAGGGPAGVAAALGAARSGVSVFLAEAMGCLGGMGTAGLVPELMTFSDGENLVAAGVAKEINHKLIEMGCVGNEYGVNIKVELLKTLYDDLLLEAGVDYTLFTILIGAEAERGKIGGAVLYGKSGLFAVKAKMYIDCTGDGDLAAMAGAPFEKGDTNGALQPGTLCTLWSDVDWAMAAGNGNHECRLEEAFDDGVFKVHDRHLPGMFQVTPHIGGGNLGHAFGVDGTDERSLTAAMIEQRKRQAEYEVYYKKYLKGFENMELVTTASILGVRETRRVTADYSLTFEDFKKHAVFEDEIGRYCYAIDQHAAKPEKGAFKAYQNIFQKDYRYDKGESYGIPYRILTPTGVENLLTAGRCVSSDRLMQASIRVMPSCFITGQAAGTAAAIAAKMGTHTRGFDVRELQAALKKAGAYLPNFKVYGGLK